MDLEKLFEGIEGADKIIAAIKENAKKAGAKLLVDDGKENTFVPKKRLDDEISKKKTIKEQLDNANKTVNTLKDDLKDNEKALEKVTDLEKTNKELETKLQETVRTQAIHKALESGERKPKDMDDLLKFINLENVKVNEDGTVVGLKEQVDELAKNKDYLFQAVEGGTGNVGNPAKKKDNSNKDFSIGADLAKANGEVNKDVNAQRQKFFE